MDQKNRSSFSGKIGFILSSAGASVGLGNIWRFPYLAAGNGGGIFVLVYIILAATFGYTMIMAETAIGRMTRKSPVGAFGSFGRGPLHLLGGWLNAVVPIIIVSYYCVIGGWVIRYFAGYLFLGRDVMASEGFFSDFIGNGRESMIWFLVFGGLTMLIIYMGVENGIERVSSLLMPALVVLSLIIAVYSCTRPGALEGVRYFLIPRPQDFSWKTVVNAMEQMFYSLSIAMGILYTFGSYMKDDTGIEEATVQVEIFDTAIAMMAGLMIIPAVFAFSGGNAKTLNAGPALMFMTIPRVFASMAGGSLVGILFFMLVTFAALTSAIALAESAVSTAEDELGLPRRAAVLFVTLVILVLGSLTALGYGPLSAVTLFGMQFLDFFDFLANSLLMPLGALATCLLAAGVIGLDRIEEEIGKGGHSFRLRGVFRFMIRTLCPVFVMIIFAFSIAGILGLVSL